MDVKSISANHPNTYNMLLFLLSSLYTVIAAVMESKSL